MKATKKISAKKTITGDYIYRDVLVRVKGNYARQVGRCWNQYFVIYKEKKIKANNLSHAKDIINDMLDDFDFFKDIYLTIN